MSESVKVPKWDGDPSKWDNFAFRLEAFVEALGYGDALRGDADASDAASKKVYAFLVTAMESDSALNLLRTVPRHDGAAAWSALLAKQEDSSSARRVALNRKLTECKQKQGERALDYTARLERLRDQLGAVGDIIADGTLTSYLLNGLLDDYEPAVQALLAVSGNNLRYETAKQALLTNSARLEARQEARAEAEAAEDTSQQALLAAHALIAAHGLGSAGARAHGGKGGKGGKGRYGGGDKGGRGAFTGMCWHCGEPGHRQADYQRLINTSDRVVNL